MNKFQSKSNLIGDIERSITNIARRCGVKDSDVTHIDILNSITIMWHYFVVSLFICSFVLRNG
jgi:hypothetical protein